MKPITVKGALQALRKRGYVCGTVNDHVWINWPGTDFYGRPHDIADCFPISNGRVSGKAIYAFVNG